jgi:hypothetical protein
MLPETGRRRPVALARRRTGELRSRVIWGGQEQSLESTSAGAERGGAERGDGYEEQGGG